MKKANGTKRAPEPQPGENVQPALVNSAVANVFDPVPEGNHAEIIEATRQHVKDLVEDSGSVKLGHDARAWQQEYERRARAMPFVRFVANGEPLPLEIGNVDKLAALDGSGTWYMFPTTENLHKSYGGEPEDPTQGQEAQGGPMHANTGRGEKYAGGNVETEMVADEFKNPQGHGKGSQTGGTGIQRSAVGDGAAIGAAVEDPDVSNFPDQHFDQNFGKDAGAGGEENGHIRPLPAGASIQQVSKGSYDNEPGIIRQSQDPDKLRTKPGLFEIVQGEVPATAVGLIDKGEFEGPGKPGKPIKVPTAVTTSMKEGQKTAADTANPLAQLDHDGDGEPGGSHPLSRDWNEADEAEVRKFLEDNDVPITTGVQLTDLRALAEKTERFGGTQPAKQKSDEATPQPAPGATPAAENTEVVKTTKMHIGGKKKAAKK